MTEDKKGEIIALVMECTASPPNSTYLDAPLSLILREQHKTNLLLGALLRLLLDED